MTLNRLAPVPWVGAVECEPTVRIPTFILLTELEVRQKREQIPAGTMLLAVEDPQTRVGSGGATLNALLVAAEHLSARAGFTVSASELLPLWPVFLLEVK